MKMCEDGNGAVKCLFTVNGSAKTWSTLVEEAKEQYLSMDQPIHGGL